MFRSTTRLFLWCGLSLLSVLSAQTKDYVDENRSRLVMNGRYIPIGEWRSVIQRSLGDPTNDKNASVWTYQGGVELTFDAKTNLDVIVLKSPFAGKTLKKIGIGSTGDDVLANYPEIKSLKAGWNQAQNIAFQINDPNLAKKGVVTGIEISKKRVPAVGDPAGNPPERPQPGRRPDDRPDNRPPVVVPPPQNVVPDHIVVWNQRFQASPTTGWIDAPATGWPTSTGKLLVRVSYSRNVISADQMFGDGVTHATGCQDYIYDPDIVSEHSGRYGRSVWKWSFVGSGEVRVQIHWFDGRKDLRNYTAANPYDAFAIREAPLPPVVSPPPYEPPTLVWEHSWHVGREPRWVRGPSGGWPSDRGVLLVRSFATPGVKEFFWKAGVGQAQTAPIGDTILPVRSIDPRGNAFGQLFGKDASALSFAFKGLGQGRVQVYWFAQQSFVPNYCDKFPHKDIKPWLGLEQDPGDWFYGSRGDWRRESSFETDWQRPFQSPPPGAVNVASPRRGAKAVRSSRERSRSLGHEFDGGLWTSLNEPYASTSSFFLVPSRLARIDIGTAGSDVDTASYILVEGRDEIGRWSRIAAFCDENINYHRLQNGAYAVSRAPISIACDGNTVYTAVRITLLGAGPFRAGNVAAWGFEVGQPNYEDPYPEAPSVVQLNVPAEIGWVDTAIELEPGGELFVLVDGSWTIDRRDAVRFGPTGADGYPFLDAVRAFGQAFGGWRNRLPAPECTPGALVGRFGNGRPFLVVPGTPIRAPRGGRLFLACNDADLADNDGVLVVTIVGGVLSQNRPGPIVDDFLPIRFIGTLTDSARRPLPFADFIVQRDDAPFTVYGGGRADKNGYFDITVNVPRNVQVAIRVPTAGVGCAPQSFTESGEFRWRGPR